MNTSGGVSMLPKAAYRRLKRIRRLPRAQQDVALAEWEREEERARWAKPPSMLPQLRLFVVEVFCKPLEGRISLAQCIARQEAKTPSGGGKGFPIHACGGCPLREVHRNLAPSFHPKPYRAFSIQRENRERAARQKAWREGRLGRVAGIDDPPAGDEE